MTTAATPIPKRSEIPDSDTWDLTHLYPDDEAWESGFVALDKSFAAIADFKGQLGTSAAKLADALEFDKSIDLQLERLFHYASLRVSEDSSNNDNLARRGRIENLHTRINEASSYMVPEIMAIDDATFATFLRADELKPWHNSLGKIRRHKPHTLTASEERLLALAATPLDGHSQTFSQLTNVDMSFGVVKDKKGHEQELTQSSFSSMLVKRDREVRKSAFAKFYQEIDDHKFTVASSMANSVKADIFKARARNFPSALEASLFQDRVPVGVYDNLISSVRDNLDPLFRYYELRRKVLELDEIHHYDTYVPMVGDIDTNYSWDEAVTMVIDALAPLGEEYTSTLKAGLSGRWCDRYETKGKRSGAFSSGSYGNPPFILMNYKADVFSDIYTLAHEGGHSMHTWYSQGHQEYQDYNYPIFTAEVASTFNEELLTHHLLEQTDDRQMRAYLINRQIDDIRGTLYRQTMFAEFEKVIHEVEERGDSLTIDVFRSEYRKLLDTYFGPDFAIDDILELEGLRIPHFYSAFYVYKYATGISAAISLSQKVLNGDSSDLEAYLGFLKSGGSTYPLETLETAGVDMRSPEPIQRALALFAKRVGELEDLLQ